MLELYGFESCPYCAKVRAKLEELHLDYIYRVSPKWGPNYEKKIPKLGGKSQVPYLVDSDRGTAMYESDDICKYLEENYKFSSNALHLVKN